VKITIADRGISQLETNSCEQADRGPSTTQLFAKRSSFTAQDDKRDLPGRNSRTGENMTAQSFGNQKSRARHG
jgi:hypothetical protein